MKSAVYMRILLVVIVAAVLAACASIGRPEGGPRDKVPPVYVGSNPAPGAVRFDGKRITIEFDENVSVEKASEKVVVSPAQKSMPQISANGKRVTVELRDTMQSNTTYTIDFSDAIRDLNESNVLEDFALDFSTGDSIDTLQIAGMVFQASNLEPAQGMLVGVHSNLSDTALTALKFDRIAKTNSYGQFTVRNLKPGSYRIFAVNDVNRDYMWDRSEDIAFYDTTITPSSSRVSVVDTLKAADGSDSIVVVDRTRFAPNDVLLTWFNEGYKAQYLKDYKRPERNKLNFSFGAPSDTLPELTLINGSQPDLNSRLWARIDAAVTGDSLQYWITDTTISAMDTMLVALRYLRTDTLDQLSWTTDTLKMNFREPKKKEEKKKPKESADSDSISVPKIEFLSFNATSGATHHIYAPLTFTASQPIDTIYPEAVHLEVQKDTIWEPLDLPPITPAKHHPLLNFTTTREWEPGTKYRLTIDSASIIGAYGLWNAPITHEFTVRKLEDYSALYFNLTGVDGRPAIVELLNGSDAPVRTAKVENDEAALLYVDPGTYYARLYIDANQNGKYDEGNVALHRQPEEVYYFPHKITLKKNWDVEQSWNIYEMPLDKQKPEEIKKNKPEKRKNWDEEENKNKKKNNSDDEFDDEYYDDSGFGSSGYGNSGYGNSRYGATGLGGLRTNTGR